MGPRLALIRLALCAALVMSAVAPTAAMAANPEEGLHEGRLSRTRILEMVFGVPLNADGIAGPGTSTPYGGDEGITDDGDQDGAGEDESGADPDAGTESTTTSTNTDYGESGDDSNGSYTGDYSNGGLTSNNKSSVGTQTLLDIIIGIIFGQDRPWDDEKRRRK